MPESGSSTRLQCIGAGRFLITLHGLPTEYTWKDLKDLVRPVATRNVWTDIPLPVNGLHSLKKGCIRLSSHEEACRAYEYLCRMRVANRPLYVELWDITKSDSKPTSMHRNYNPHHGSTPTNPGDIERLARDASSWRQISPGYPPQTLIQYTVRPPPPPGPILQPYSVQPVGSNFRAQQLPGAQYFQQPPQYYAQPAPIQQQHTGFAISSDGLPINTRNGCAKTEARAVFVTQLSYKAKEPELEAHFSQAGKVISCQIKKDPKTRKSRGYAQIEYGSTQEAACAIDMFNGSEYMGMRLHVRSDKDKTTAVPPRAADTGPLIVNGSVRSRSSKSSR